MAASGERINYALRPAKHIERLMICDALRRLWPWGHLESYQYIGFGSWYFSDFRLFHKLLGINSMYSIEYQENAERVEFNRPFRHVEMVFGDSSEVLPDMDWTRRSIVWLDYDKKISDAVLSDIDVVISKCTSGTVILFTVSAETPVNQKAPLSQLKSAVDPIRIPPGVTDDDLRVWGLARVSHKILRNQIIESLRTRNLLQDESRRLEFRQLFHFRYADGVRMLTVGGILVEVSQVPQVDRCAFGELPFCRSDENAFVIRVPRMTYREQRHLDQQLPVGEAAELTSPGMNAEDLRDYAAVYRYYPTFVDAEV